MRGGAGGNHRARIAEQLAWLGVEPWVEPFRKDPRYNELLREIGLAAQK